MENLSAAYTIMVRVITRVGIVYGFTSFFFYDLEYTDFQVQNVIEWV